MKTLTMKPDFKTLENVLIQSILTDELTLLNLCRGQKIIVDEGATPEYCKYNFTEDENQF